MKLSTCPLNSLTWKCEEKNPIQKNSLPKKSTCMLIKAVLFSFLLFVCLSLWLSLSAVPFLVLPGWKTNTRSLFRENHAFHQRTQKSTSLENCKCGAATRRGSYLGKVALKPTDLSLESRKCEHLSQEESELEHARASRIARAESCQGTPKPACAGRRCSCLALLYPNANAPHPSKRSSSFPGSNWPPSRFSRARMQAQNGSGDINCTTATT